MLKNWVKKRLDEVILSQGALVSEEVYQHRSKICSGCPYLGEVKVKGIKRSGCTKCGCPSETKLRMEYIMRAKDNIGNPLEAEELLKTIAFSKLNPDNYRKEVIKCPFNKWW